jgi:hypothetical protein
MLAAESELLEALERLSTADSDAAWQEAVNARNIALRRLMRAVSELPLDEREIVVARATHAAARERMRANEHENGSDEARIADMPDRADHDHRNESVSKFDSQRPLDDGRH